MTVDMVAPDRDPFGKKIHLTGKRIPFCLSCCCNAPEKVPRSLIVHWSGT
ncbi:hypothetical protein KCP78_17655 [Salmonella enterica subsp. enterica]|nr:hypothetical protein KCP78_17655 [Salmonella enterica subsp. enterica]